MTTDDLIKSFRLESGDQARSEGGGQSDVLWSDEEIAGWLTEAEEEAAIRRRLLPDEVSIPITAPTRAYSFTSFFEITYAELVPAAGDRIVLKIVSRDAMNRIDPEWRRASCKPRTLIQEDVRIVLAGEVAEAYSLYLEGLRLPKNPLSADIPTATPEIAPVHHRFLVHWALHRAYGIQDAEAFDASRSQRELATFERYFGLRPDADLRKDARADEPHQTIVWRF
ncbi:hypothetical protein [Variovorax paradoxus]|uniref:Uncharacterized protein n=1 Tax=Variovorax paradoxus (strain EPS) TaxID=595537 RepID=E6V9T6_VARPE|nr:hypothetical protein [Variovorax paradoxus]ADU36224.1 hypothetical protein Varpa_2016 [Variovorax paradoxus EPS]